MSSQKQSQKTIKKSLSEFDHIRYRPTYDTDNKLMEPPSEVINSEHIPQEIKTRLVNEYYECFNKHIKQVQKENKQRWKQERQVKKNMPAAMRSAAIGRGESDKQRNLHSHGLLEEMPKSALPLSIQYKFVARQIEDIITKGYSSK